jgi:hypothetical protein
MSVSSGKKAKGTPIQIPVSGDGEHNAGVFLALGGLIIHWANNESVFLAMLQALIHGDRENAGVIWHSQTNTRARLELVGRLTRQRVRDPQLIKDIMTALSQFRGFTNVRNFFCHATYLYDADGKIASANSVVTVSEGIPLRLETKTMHNGTLNEIADASLKLLEFNAHLWALVERLEGQLGVPPAMPPPSPQSH